jgi:KaiC/GvpD/RAD55 family RecA-like ATPase
MTFLYRGAELYNRSGVYITFEEDVQQIKANCKEIGLDLEKYEDKIILMDLPSLRKFYTNKEEITNENSLLDIDNLIDILNRNCKDTDLIAIDSIVPLSMKYSNLNMFRAALFRLKLALKDLKATTIMTTEVPSSNMTVISRFDIEDFLADSVTVLKMGEFEKDINNWYSEKHFSERYLRIHKLRGSNHVKAFVEYRISSEGLQVIPPTR